MTVDLPEGARYNGVRIRLWQPSHPGLGKADWAVDNIIIGGNLSTPDLMSDAFQVQPSLVTEYVENDIKCKKRHFLRSAEFGSIYMLCTVMGCNTYCLAEIPVY